MYWLDSRHQVGYDVTTGARLLPLKFFITSKYKQGNYTIVDMFNETLAKFSRKEAVVFEGKSLTFQDLDLQSNAVAQWALNLGLRKGDTIAMFMENCTEFITTWLGMAKIGVKSALINNNLKRKPLLHSLTTSGASVVIFGPEQTDQLSEVLGEITMRPFCYGTSHLGEDLFPLLASSSSSPVSAGHREGLGMGDTFGYIYTSGTTGMPKPAIVTHAKMIGGAAGFSAAYKLTPEDRVFTALPLYHSSASLAAFIMLYMGATLVLKRRFSVRNFWSDVAESRSTVVQYIGELCRYLLLAPEGPADKAHRVRIFIGNGMRPDIWGRFQERFAVPEVGEFYGSTEGALALFNHCTTPAAQGAVGRMGAIMRAAVGIVLVKFDVDAEEPVRGPDGLCQPCAFGEAGELLMPIKDGDPTTRFVGYTDSKATEKKIMRNVLRRGDKYFRSGDLLTLDAKGYYHFVDRIGDTFRWKGENVSTNEVAEALSATPGVAEVNVYGVTVPGNQDGRACMAGLVLQDGEVEAAGGRAAALERILPALLAQAKNQLPTYAMPLFVRLLPVMETTGTFKLQKVVLRKEGMDPSLVSDPMYYLNSATKKFEPLTPEAFVALSTGRSRL